MLWDPGLAVEACESMHAWQSDCLGRRAQADCAFVFVHGLVGGVDVESWKRDGSDRAYALTEEVFPDRAVAVANLCRLLASARRYFTASNERAITLLVYFNLLDRGGELESSQVFGS